VVKKRKEKSAAIRANKCENCGKTNANPRFCNRSCAATKNNIEVPKRKPEGNCEKCGTPVFLRKRYCQQCQIEVKAEKEEQERRCQENYQSWLTPTGEVRERPIQRARMRTVFRLDREDLSERLNGQSPAHELIDYLIGICFAGTPYLRQQDAMRYISLLADLNEFNYRDWSNATERKIKVGELCIDYLPRAVRQWVDAYLEQPHHPMMPAYAMDAARFLERHMVGYETFDWTIEPLLPPGRFERSEFFDSAFRRRFTTKFGPLVGCRVPNAGYWLRQPDWMEPLHPGNRFLLRIHRCHLSERSDAGFGIIGVDEDLRFDLMEEFCFVGTVLLSREKKRLATIAPEDCPTGFEQIHGYDAGIDAAISGRWITHAITWPGDLPYPEAVPRWTVEGTEANLADSDT